MFRADMKEIIQMKCPTLKEITKRAEGAPSHQHFYQELHTRLTTYYKRNCHWLCYKFPVSKVSQAFSIQEKEGDTEFNHLLKTIQGL